MKSKLLVVTVLAIALAIWGWVHRQAPTPKLPAGGQPAAAERETWLAEDIAKDPQGYLLWSDKKVAQQVTDRERRLSALGARRTDWELRRKTFEQNLGDLENMRRRLSEAYQHADEEDRWPLSFAGRTLTRDKSLRALDQMRKAIDDRLPDRKMYEDVVAKMDEAANAYRNDIQKLTRLREKMEADLEQVRLTQDLAKVGELRKTEDQLASMSKAVAGMSDDSGALPAAKPPSGPMTLDDILNK